MKTTLFVLGILVISLVACTQKTPTTAVTNAFAQKFKGAEKVKWDMEESNEWEAEFKLSEKAISASFDLAGKWLETEVEIEKSEVPLAVKTAIEKEYVGAKMGEVSNIETPDFNGYEIALKRNDK